ncbi:hypothetical protein GALL_524910 [mine drainage metagenome]|uniref:Uncharacterized protein n=1 Tax=mine drainage metagenome TaxID=410659 RepID=A0A1J5P310_9ZZZZ
MARLTTGGPLSPLGRSLVSTRNTKPSPVTSDSSGTRRRTTSAKYSALPSGTGPSVSPSSSYTQTRSMSDETLSSRPPSLPMPTTMNSAASPSAVRGVPWRGARSACTARSPEATTASARSLMPMHTASSGAPDRSTSISRNISALRTRRNAVGREAPACCKVSMEKSICARDGIPSGQRARTSSNRPVWRR